MNSRQDRVSPLDRRKAAFIGEYEDLCRRHRLMVDLGDDGNGYAFFAVADFTKAPDELVQALEEMRISPLTVLAP